MGASSPVSAEDVLGQQFTQRRAAQLAEKGQSLMRGAPQPVDVERTGPTGVIQGGVTPEVEADAAKLKAHYEHLEGRAAAQRAAKTAQSTGDGRGSRLDTCVVCSQVVPADPAKRGKCFGFTRSHYTPRDQLRVVSKEER